MFFLLKKLLVLQLNLTYYKFVNCFIIMKKTTFQFLSFLVAAGLIVSSCGSDMLKRIKEVSYKVTPKPLEMHGGRVPVLVSVSFPANFFAKNATIVLTPKLVYNGGETAVTPVGTIQGEEVLENNPIKVPFEKGGTFVVVKDTIPYTDAMRVSKLVMSGKIYIGNTPYDLPDSVLADGIVTTPNLVKEGCATDGSGVDNDLDDIRKRMGNTSTVSLPPVSDVTESAKVLFDLQRTEVKASETKKDEVKNLIEKVKVASTDPTKTFKGIKIASYASPEGTEEINRGLVNGRGKSSQEYLKKEFEKAKLPNVKDASFITLETTPDEDWDGFRNVTQNSSLKDKDLILRVLSMYNDPVVREREIKNMSAAYTTLKSDILPQLRRSEIRVVYSPKQKSDAEIRQAAMSNPSSLKQEELKYAAQTETDLAKRAQIWKSYTSLYPDDWEGFNNLGICYVEQKNFNDAKTAFEKASSRNENGKVLNNLGIVYFLLNQKDNAQRSFEKAKTKGEPANYYLGVLYFEKGRYADASSIWGNITSFNNALAKIVTGDNNGAMRIIDDLLKTKQHSAIYYLKAVAAARTKQDRVVLDNLKTATEKDSRWKEYAKKDIEFVKYFNNEEFKRYTN